MKQVICIVIALLFSVTITASRSKVGLVLSGGGAKGAAEVGILKVIDKARKYGLEIDYIAGTSMGALIGGLYAAGISPDDIERLMLTEKWLSLYSKDAVGYFSKNYWRAPTGLVRDVFLQNKLDSVFSSYGCRFFSDTIIPFNCVAVNINDMTEVYLKEGVLARSIVASMAYPGFLPIQQDGMNLIDGGVLNNLPVDVVRRMGADIVIAIDLEQTTRSTRNFSLKGALGIGGIANWLVSRPDVKKRNENIKDANVYIHPNLTAFSIKDFESSKLIKMIEIGEQEGNKFWNILINLK